MVRIDYRHIAKEPWALLSGLVTYSKSCAVPYGLIELVKLRVSQINGCGHCIAHHSRVLREEIGEAEERLENLAKWRDAKCFTDRERAAFAWAETVTEIANFGVSDSEYETARASFDEAELTDLTFAIVTINSHNRLALALGG